MKRTFLSLVSMAFICAMTLTSCEEIMSAIDNPVGSYVQFNDSVLNLTPGQVAQNVATTISTEKVTYTSSDKSIATVDPNGFVTAISYGEAIITASVPANENYQAGSASYKVKVGSELAKALKEGAIVSFDLNVDGVDESVSFKKVGDNFVIENPMASAPRRAAAITTSYSLGYNKATNIMTLLVKQTDGINTAYPLTVIFDLNKNTMQIIPGSPLSTVLFVNIKINGVTITGKLTKKEVAPEAVAITGAPSPFVMAVGDADVTLTAVINPADATDKKVTWSSSAPAVATIDETGNVHAVAVGSTTIKVTTSNGKEASIALTVKDPIVDLSKLTAAYIAKDGETLTGTLGGNYKISIAAGATVTLDGVTINGVNDANYTWAGINCEGNAIIILKDGSANTVKGFQADYPGIHVKAGYTLTIKGDTQGTGSLTATGSTQGAGIGAGNWKECGNIVISGGTINATAGGLSAGIGGGNNGTCGTISITGGNVTAVGVTGGAGIGGGNGGSCGNISITGGTVTATGAQFGAGIGAGSGYSTGTSSICGNISITGGTVNATGGQFSAGIGTGPRTPGGSVSQCGNITITSGVTKVMATKGGSAPHSIGIGGNGATDYNGVCGTVTIGGTVGAITTTPYTYQP